MSVNKEDKIVTLSARDHFRLRSGMWAGDTGNSNQLVLEVFANALDCYNAGFGKLIIINIKDGIISCEDQGMGFNICEMREDGLTTMEAAVSVNLTSGKFNDDGVYQGTSLGLNGAGSKICNFLSHWFRIKSHKNGKWEELYFREGILESRDSGEDNLPSGTIVEFQPSEEFFDDPNPDIKFIEKFLNDISCMCPDLTIKFNGNDIKHDGIEDMLTARVGKSIETINSRLIFTESIGKQTINLGMTFTDNNSSNITAYVNCGNTDTGPHLTAIKSSITRVLNSWAKENGLLKSSDKNLEGSHLQEGMILVCNITSPTAEYNAQVKTTITKIDTGFITQTLSQQLEVWLDNNPDCGTVIVNQAITARKAADAAKKARAAVKNKKETAKKPKILHPDKLKDAEFLGEESTLLLVEGLSAGASMAVARDPASYGILMLRGKLINAFSNSEEKLLKNEEIQLLFKALNIEPGRYDASELRYGKVAITVDSDSDGYHIALLIMTALQHFCPQFIEEGRLCWLRSPLYIVKNGKNEQYYFNDAEMDAVRGKVTGEVQRNKGLGSLSASQAKASMFGPDQHMDVIIGTPQGVSLLQDLMGTSVVERKKFVFNEIDFSEVRE